MSLKSLAITLPLLPKTLPIPIARAPLPVPKSAHNPSFNISFPSMISLTKSTIFSVSGLGIKTPSSTLNTKSLQCSHPTTYWNGLLSSTLCFHKTYKSPNSTLNFTKSPPSLKPQLSIKFDLGFSRTSSNSQTTSLFKFSEVGPLSDSKKVDPTEEARVWAQLCHFWSLETVVE